MSEKPEPREAHTPLPLRLAAWNRLWDALLKPVSVDLAHVTVTAYGRALFAALEAASPSVVWCAHGELRRQCPACGGDALSD